MLKTSKLKIDATYLADSESKKNLIPQDFITDFRCSTRFPYAGVGASFFCKKIETKYFIQPSLGLCSLIFPFFVHVWMSIGGKGPRTLTGFSADD